MNVTAARAGWPRRYVVVALTFLGVLIAYTDRVNISVAAVAMKEHFGWSQTEKGFVLAAFFVGYLLSMFAAGLLANHLGGKRLVGYSVLAWSFFTLLTPTAATFSMAVLIATRIGMGAGEAGMYPAAYELFGRWVPSSERARAMAFLTSGGPVGTLIGLMGSGWLVQRYGWAMPFYVFGIVGILWLMAWVHKIENDPARDPRIDAEERTLLQAARPTTDPVERVPLRRLLLRAPVAGDRRRAHRGQLDSVRPAVLATQLLSRRAGAEHCELCSFFGRAMAGDSRRWQFSRRRIRPDVSAGRRSYLYA